MKNELIKTEIIVKDTSIRVMRVGNVDYISLTDLAKFKDEERFDYIIQNWLRSKHTLEYVGTWELLYNQNFNSTEFDGFKNEAGTHSFVMTPKYPLRFNEKYKTFPVFCAVYNKPVSS